MSDYFPSSAETTQDADLFELSVSCVGVVPCLAPAEFCTTLSSQRHQNVFDDGMLIVNAFFSVRRHGRQRWLSGEDASCVVAKGLGI